MKNLNLSQIAVINGGRTNSKEFCSGFGAVAAVYGAGLAFNLWNPIGWGGTAALAVVGVYCIS